MKMWKRRRFLNLEFIAREVPKNRSRNKPLPYIPKMVSSEVAKIFKNSVKLLEVGFVIDLNHTAYIHVLYPQKN